MRKSWRLLAVLPLIALFAVAVTAQEKAKPKPKPGDKGQAAFEAAVKAHKFIGSKKCKTCHRGEHKTWLETAHAKAWESLKPEDRKNKECVACHSTGVIAKNDSLITGVGCEACHGPGNDYKKKKVMEDREASVNGGLIIPDAETCQRCHNPKSPNYKEFDFEKFKAKGLHDFSTREKAAKKAAKKKAAAGG